MINKKLGISIPWLVRSNSVFYLNQEIIRKYIKNIFLKQNIFISDVFIQEYPKLIYIIFNVFPTSSKQYKLIKLLINIINNVLTILLKKNIFISFNLSPNLYDEIGILSNWLSLKLYSQPSNIKKLLKQTLRQYDTITK